MAQGRQLPEIKTPDDLDELDLQILAALEVDPKVTCREVSEKTGKPISSVWDRIRRIRKSDWVEQMRDELRSLGPKTIVAVEGGIDNGEHRDRAAVALRLLSGLGVTTEKSEHRVIEIPATPDDIANAIRNLSTAELADLDSRLAEDRARESGGADADSGVVAGEDASPDPQGSGA